MAFRSGSRGVEVLSGSAIAGRFVDGLVLDLAAERKFRRGELYETREGLCRVGPPIAKELAGFGPVCEPRLSLMRSGSRKRSLGRGRRAAKRQVGADASRYGLGAIGPAAGSLAETVVAGDGPAVLRSSERVQSSARPLQRDSRSRAFGWTRTGT